MPATPDGALDGAALRALAAAGRGLADAYLFVRASVLGFTLLLPLAGALAVSTSLDGATTLGLVLIAASFHLFAYVFNDVVDLPIDRRAAQRAHDPLVTGRIGRTTALGIALAQVPVAALAAAWLGAGSAALLALGGAFVLLGAYDLWGKRCPWPPLIDFIQALGWACLLAFGALTVGPLTHEALWLGAAVIAYVMLVNGVHGALRDLRSDIAAGVRTTATFFGARAGGRVESLTVPPPLLAYGAALHAALLVAIGAALGPPPRPDDLRWWLAAALLAAAAAVCAGLVPAAYRSRNDAPRAEATATAHLYVCMSMLAIPCLADAQPLFIAVVAGVLTLPVLARHTYHEARQT